MKFKKQLLTAFIAFSIPALSAACPITGYAQETTQTIQDDQKKITQNSSDDKTDKKKEKDSDSKNKTIPVTKVTLDKTKAELTVGDSIKLIAEISPSDATDKTLIWSSSNKKIATVNDDGTVNALKAGTVSITVKTKSAGKTAVCKMTVKEKNGWYKEDGAFKYYKNGKAYTGWHKMGKAEGESPEHWSYFDNEGKIYTGWHKMDKKQGEKVPHWSFFGNNGWLVTGWKYMDRSTGEKTPHWSYFGNNGWLVTGWKYMDRSTGEKTPHWSYFGSNGWLRTNWQHMGKGTNNPDGNSVKHWSYFGPNGWLRTGWQQMGTNANPDGKAKVHWSFFGGNGWLATGTVNTENGVKGTFDRNGWLTATQRDIRYYINQDEAGFQQGCAGATLLTAFHMRGFLTGMTYPQFMGTMLYAPIERSNDRFRANPNNGYHGDPTAHRGYIGTGTGYGNAIYPHGIVKWVNKLKKEGYKINCEVTDISGCDVNRLIEEVRKGNTPLVQVTWHYQPKTPIKEWWGYYVMGHHFNTLIGYDYKNDRFKVADPDWPDDSNKDKTRWIDGNTFRKIYNIQKHAVLVK